MKLCVVVLCFMSATLAVPTNPAVAARRALPALQHQEVHDNFGQYAFQYVTAEGTKVSERGRLVPNPDDHGNVLIIEGEVSYIGDDGKTYVSKYSAGFDGTHVEAAHIPVPVAVP